MEHGRYLARNMEGAKYVELDGDDHLFAENAERVARTVQEFLTGHPPPEYMSGTPGLLMGATWTT